MASNLGLPGAAALLSSFLYPAGKMLLHRKTGGTYKVLGACYIERDLEPSYIYGPLGSDVVFVRPRHEMEDGRFVPVSTPFESPACTQENQTPPKETQ